MEVLAEVAGRTYGSVAVSAPADFTSPFNAPFACLIWEHGAASTEDERAAFADRLLAAGCSYAVCGGANCEAWHDAVDEAVVARMVADGADEPAHVMTTWHDGEGPDDVASFFVLNTDFGEHKFQQYLVVHVGTSDEKGRVDEAVRGHARSQRGLHYEP